MYGSDAANGAIVVTTKKGQVGQLSVTATAGVEIMSPLVLPEFQNRYGTGNLTTPINVASYSWGKRLNRANRYGYDPREDYFRAGVVNSESVSLSTGTEKNQTYFSAAAINSDGIVPNNSYDRYNFTFRNTTSFLNDKMRLDVGASYVLQEDCNMINQGTYNNPLTGAYLFPRGDDWADIEMYERYDPIDKISKQYWPMGDGSITMQNPYWANYRNLRENRKDRYMLNAALSYDILDWLNVSGRIRLDNSHNTYTEKMYASSNVQLTEQSANGLYGVTKTMDRQVYGDALLNINKTFGDDWSLQANIGASFSDMKNDALKIRGPIADGTSGEKQGLANVFNIQNLSNSTKTVRKQEGWREQTQSIFASAEVGYKGTYYLTLTGRNDWPSQLAGPHSNAKSFFYPSVGLSVVLSQLIPNMPENLSYIKLRGSFASVGVAFERYIANPLYSWNESGLSWNTQTQYPAYHLKPERTKSFEVGSDDALPQALSTSISPTTIRIRRTRPSTRRSRAARVSPRSSSSRVTSATRVSSWHWATGTPGATSRGIPTTPCRPTRIRSSRWPTTSSTTPRASASRSTGSTWAVWATRSSCCRRAVRWATSTPAAICATTRTTPFTSTRTEMWLRRRSRM